MAILHPNVATSVGRGEEQESVFITHSQVILMLRTAALEDGKTELDGGGFF